MKGKLFPICLALSLVAAACSGPDMSDATSSWAQPFSVAPTFQAFYAAHGGLSVFGAAISPELDESGVRVQYFQNAKLQYYPQLPAGSQIILSNLGQLLYGSTPCVNLRDVKPGALYFEATCHSVGPEFRGFFEKLGGVPFLGYPISEMYIVDQRFVQHFERASIVWDGSKPPDFQYSLAGLGRLACDRSNCSASLGPANYAPPPATPTPTAPLTDRITRFYQNHGEARMFGLPLTSRRVGADGKVEQVFENAILYENPAAPEGVSLRPLGLAALGAAEPAAPPTGAPRSIYFTQYGHNVAYGFYDIFTRYGGEAVFGQPVAEMRIVENYFTQYFENAVIVWDPAFPAEQSAQLADLGRQALVAERALPTPTPRAVPPQSLSVVTNAVFAILDPSRDQQTLQAQVLDENGAPVANAKVSFTVHTPQGDAVYVVEATDGNGYAAATFTLKSYNPGDFIMYDAAAAYGGLSASQSAAFVPWGNPNP